MKELDQLARDRAIDKIRKLLAMANDGRGNEQEAATAASQAEKLMRHYQIESSDVVLEELQHTENFAQEIGDTLFNGDSDFHVKRPAGWVGFIAIGCGAAFTCKVDVVRTPKGVKVRFSGYAMDVSLCKWVYTYLCQTVYRLSKPYGRGGDSFRKGAGGVLQERLYAIKTEREASAKAPGNGTALVLVDTKARKVQEMFGGQTTKQAKFSTSDAEAYYAGAAAGRTMDINTNRPLASAAQAVRIAA